MVLFTGLFALAFYQHKKLQPSSYKIPTPECSPKKTIERTNRATRKFSRARKQAQHLRKYPTRLTNVDLYRESDLPLIHRLVMQGNLRRVENLILWSANVNRKESSRNSTPLHLAARDRNFKMMELLLRFGADVNARERNGRTVLHLISEDGHYGDNESSESFSKIISLLLRYDCDLEQNDFMNRTPLHIACHKDNEGSCILALLRHGANINAEDVNRKIPLEYCEDNFRFSLMKEHMLKLKAIDFQIHKDYRYYSEDTYIERLRNSEFLQICEDEKKKMKNVKISNITLYDVMLMSPNDMASYVENEMFKDIVTSKNFDDKYPTYGCIIKRQYRYGLERRALICFKDYLIRHGLPDLCIDNVFKYINNGQINPRRLNLIPGISPRESDDLNDKEYVIIDIVDQRQSCMSCIGPNLLFSKKVMSGMVHHV